MIFCLHQRSIFMHYKKIIPLLFLFTSLVNAQEPINKSNNLNNNINSLNNLTFSSSYKQEVEQDKITIKIQYNYTDSNASAVQNQINLKTSKALEFIKSKLKNNKNYTVKTGQISVNPIYKYNNAKQTIENWRGYSEVILEGQNSDIEKTSSEQDLSHVTTFITTTATQVPDFYISSVNFSLSDEKIQKLKDSTVKQAINNYRQEAKKLTDNFGFKSFKIKEVNISYNPNDHIIYPMATNASAAIGSFDIKTQPTLTTQPGKTVIEANVSGTIEMSNN